MSFDPKLSNERKRVTVLFADISESTRVIERLDPEEAASLLTPPVAIMTEVVERYEGTVVKAMGDGIMAIFGAPLALEHHAHRACHAALEMQRLVQSSTGGGDGRPRSDVRIHVGLATGEVVAGFLGGDLHSRYDAAGFTIHLASRLQSLAPAGAIYLNHATYKEVRDLFDCEDLGQKKIRGTAETVEVYRLRGARRESHARQAFEPRDRSSPFVGRTSELRALSAAADALLSGHGAAVSVIGEAGLGKSRLIDEFRRRVAGLPVLWLEGASQSYGGMLSYLPFLQILRQLAGIAEEDDEATGWTRLERRVSGLFASEADDVLPYLATFLGIRVAGELEERVRYLDGEAIRRQVFRTMRLLFDRVATETPTIVVFEDAFWMDLSSAALLTHLLPLIETTPLLICIATRGAEDGADAAIRTAALRDHADRYSEIVLKPLAADDTNRLIDQLIRVPDLPYSIRRTLLATSEGNPLFIEESVRALIDAKIFAADKAGGDWRMPTAGAPHLEIPGSIQSVIMARVDRLEEKAKETLKTASVIGRQFFVRVLALMIGSEVTTRDGLAALRRADLVLDRRQDPEPECIFKHALVQEATYDSVLVKRRRELHALAGTALEQIFSGRLEEMYGLLAYHFARAELWERAQHYLLRAGEQADRLAADEEALSHFQLASDAYLRAFGHEAEPIWQATIARKIGEAFYRKGDAPEAQERFRQALKLLGASDPRSATGLHLEILGQIAVQVAHRLVPMRIFDGRIGKASPAEEERIRIYIMQWWLHFFESPQRTFLYSLKTLNESERSGSLIGIVHSCSTLGFVCDVLGMPRLALAYHRRANARSADSENPVVVGHAVLGMGWHHAYTGQWEAAIDNFRLSAEVSRRAGDLRQWGSAVWGMTLLLCDQGRFAIAWENAHELFEISEASGDQVNLRWSRVAEAMVLLRIGAYEQADDRLHAALRDGRSAADWQIFTKATCELARSSLLQGRTAEGRDFIRQAEAGIRARGLRGHHVAEVRNMAAAVLIATVDDAGGARAPLGLRWRAGRACRRAVRGGMVVSGSLPEALRLRGSLAWATGRPETAELWWARSLAVAERLGATHELGLTTLEIGRRRSSPELAARGAAILAGTREGLPASLPR